MIFLDLDNFRQSLFIKDKKRFYDFGKFQYFLIRYLNKTLNFVNCNEESFPFEIVNNENTVSYRSSFKFLNKIVIRWD